MIAFVYFAAIILALCTVVIAYLSLVVVKTEWMEVQDAIVEDYSEEE